MYVIVLVSLDSVNKDHTGDDKCTTNVRGSISLHDSLPVSARNAYDLIEHMKYREGGKGQFGGCRQVDNIIKWFLS